ncbi:MAG: molybdenum cofactor biosynthesis protein MoaA, partial [Thermoproteota archaeon]
MDILSNYKYNFILETNGILIGYNKKYAEELSKYKFLHVRVSLKGTNEEEFSKLTNAEPSAFRLQINALKNLLEENVSCHAAAMLSFSSEEGKAKLIEELKKI